MRVERIDTTAEDWCDDPRLTDYRLVRDPERLRGSEAFLAEGRRIAQILLTRSPYASRSILATEAAYAWLEQAAPGTRGDLPAYVVSAAAMERLSGHRFHQGCLAAGRRPAPLTVRRLLAALPRPARCLVALDGVTDPDNVGAIFRSAAALGADAVVLSPTCCSPLYRKAIRTSMGASLWLPFAHGTPWPDSLAALSEAGLTLIALSPDETGVPLDRLGAQLPADARPALLLGAEGQGLGARSLAAAHHRARIPIRPDMDSLNVAAAAAIALDRLVPASGRR